MNTCSARPSMNCVSRFGASRKSSALRDWAACRGRAGRSGPRRGSRTASPSPCTPASRRAPPRAAGRSGWRGSGRGSPRRARACGRPRRRSAFASSIIAHSSPSPGSTPASVNSAGSTWRSVVAELGQAERVGEALRRVDRQHRDLLAAGRHPGRDRRRGRRLADPARAGADADALALEQLGDRRPSAAQLLGRARAISLDPELGLEQERQRRHRAPRSAPRAGRAARAARARGGSR